MAKRIIGETPGQGETLFTLVADWKNPLIRADPVGKVQKARERMDEGRRVGHDLAILFEGLGEHGPGHPAQILQGIKRIDAIFWQPEVAVARLIFGAQPACHDAPERRR